MQVDKRRVFILGALAGAYKGGQLERLTRKHALFEGAPKAFCGYNADNLADEFSMRKDDIVPTCPRCKKSFDSKMARGVIEFSR